jgi:SpoVK/Ycf46/Vps4 family AAA+-type ATPase
MTQFSAVNDSDLPKGIHADVALPNVELAHLWDSIILAQDVKERLVSQAVLNFTIRPKVSRSILPLHGVLLLVGPPGTGKTTLAKGLANRIAELMKGQKMRLLQVDPHALTSSAMGKTQRAVSELFSQTIAEAASLGPTIVLLDEVETLAADRAKLSMDANPVDVHRATDAVLVQLDALAERFPNLLFVATSNFPQAVDAAFTSRCDLVLHIPLPDAHACRKILTGCLSGLASTFPNVGKLASMPEFGACATACEGLDGRTIRKVVVNALAQRKETAINPNLLSTDDLIAAAAQAKLNRNGGGV